MTAGMTLGSYTPLALPDGAAAVQRADGTVLRLGQPAFGAPMFYPSQTVAAVGDAAHVVHDLGPEGLVTEVVDLRFDWTLDDRFTAVQPYIMYGQSLAMNLGHDRSLSAVPVAPGRALMYANGAAGAQMSASDRPGHDSRDFGPCHFPASDVARLEDLHEQRGESPVSMAVAGLLAGLASDTGVIATNHARGGMAILKLMPKRLAEGRGTGIQYAGILRAALRTRQFCDARARRMDQPLMSFIQGETAQPDDAANYARRLLALQTALTQDLSVITGLSDPVRLFTDQTCVMWDEVQHPDRTCPPIAVTQLRTALAHPGRIFCVGPKYALPRRSTHKGRGDPVHLLPEASALWGDYHGRAIRQTLSAAPWLPLHVAGYRRSGAEIVLEVSGGDGSPLVIDTDTVRPTARSVFGFRWLQDGAAPQVISVTVDCRRIHLTLDRDPGVAGRDFAQGVLAVGLHADSPLVDQGPLTGGRTNIRDSCPDISRYGAAMPNWLCHDWVWDDWLWDDWPLDAGLGDGGLVDTEFQNSGAG